MTDELTDHEVELTVPASTAPQAPPPPQEAPAGQTSPQRSRGADTRALTQVLFAQLKELTPGTPEHDRVRGALIEANL
ncbi:RNA polymerase sigma factor, partial [Streptomyces leeuwenhoekii]